MVSQEYDRKFFDDHRGWARSSADVVAPLLIDLVAPDSVVDVGCGVGTWLSSFRAAGVTDVLGLDGGYVDRSRVDIPMEQFRAVDLEEPLPPGRRFDLAMSLEVAEHLPAERGSGFVADLVALAPVVLFSAAVPHQGGTHHVNERWPDYWSSLFAVHGYEPADCLRPRLWDDDRVAWWYAQNILVFVSPERPELLRALRALPGWDIARPPRLVHPARYLEWVEYAVAESRARWTSD